MKKEELESSIGYTDFFILHSPHWKHVTHGATDRIMQEKLEKG